MEQTKQNIRLKLLMLRGLPACGKSTFAHDLLKNEPGKWKRTNKDDLRQCIDGGQWSKENEEMIVNIRNTIIHHALNHGYNVVVDDTGFGPHEAVLREIAKNHSAEFEIKDFTDVPLSTCLKRDQERAASVGKDVIMRMYKQYVVPMKEAQAPKPFEYPKDGTPAICVDIDGTLAKMVNRGPYDWLKVENDEVVEEVKEVINKYCIDHRIIILSGRDSVCRPHTTAWLTKNQIHFDELLMRPKDNNEKDSIIKESLFREHVAPHHRVKFILDDRDQVVEMWRSIGVRCFQVAPGNF